MKRNCRQQELEYNNYRFNVSEAFGITIVACIVVIFLSVIFYRSLIGTIVLSPIGILVWRNEKKKRVNKRKEDLCIQFKDCIQSVGANLKAGYSVENAFKESYSDIVMLHGEKSCMAIELNRIIQGVNNNVSLEKLLLSLGKRSGVADIREFAEVFGIAKRNGGNMAEVLTKTSYVISRKMEIDMEIQVLISAKRLEQQIMNLIPFLIIIYISFTSPGFFDVLYHNVMGICIMTICLLVYFIAYGMAAKIMNIIVE